MFLKYCLLAAIGLSCGAVVSAGIFTFITSLGIIMRLAQATKTAAYLHWYENSIIAGAIFGNLLWLYQFPLGLGSFGMALFGLFAGIFTGCLIGAIAEILNAFPILFRRLQLKEGVAFVIAALAAGKFTGVIIQFFLFSN